MDEPLSNLDAQLRVQTRAEILKLQQELGTTTIYVTHDQVEAMTMGDRIAVMKLGVLQQVGAPEELYREPQNLFVASFIGSPAMNLVPAEVMDGAGGTGRIAGFRPEHIDVANGRSGGLDFDARVDVVEYLGDEQLVHLTRKETAIQAKLPVEEQVGPGQVLNLTVPRDKLFLFDAATEQRVRTRAGAGGPAARGPVTIRSAALVAPRGLLPRPPRPERRGRGRREPGSRRGRSCRLRRKARGPGPLGEELLDRRSLVCVDSGKNLEDLAPEAGDEALALRAHLDVLERLVRCSFVSEPR